MTALIIVGVLAALAGYVAGRVQRVGRHHSRAMQPWCDHVLGCALYPPGKLLELEAVKS